MPAIKARKIDAANMTTPVNVWKRSWNGSAYVWTKIADDMFCEFRSQSAASVNTGMMTIGATHHQIYTRFQPGILPGMKLENYVAGTFSYVQNVVDVEQVHQWLNIVSVEALLDVDVQIKRSTIGKSQYRNVTRTPSVIASCKAIFAEPSPGALSILADRVGQQNFWAVGVPEDTNVTEGDDLVIVNTGESYKVHSVRSPMSFKALLTLMVGNQS